MSNPPPEPAVKPPPAFDQPFFVVFIATVIIGWGWGLLLRIMILTDGPPMGIAMAIVGGCFGGILALPNTLAFYLAFSRDWPPLKIVAALAALALSIAVFTFEASRNGAMVNDVLRFVALTSVLMSAATVLNLLLVRFIWQWRLNDEQYQEPQLKVGIAHLLLLTAGAGVVLAVVRIAMPPDMESFFAIVLLVGAFYLPGSAIAQFAGMWTLLRFEETGHAVGLLIGMVSAATIATLVFLSARSGPVPKIPSEVVLAVGGFISMFTFITCLPHFTMRMFGRRIVAGKVADD